MVFVPEGTALFLPVVNQINFNTPNSCGAGPLVSNLLTIRIFLILSASSGGIPAVPKSTELKTVIADSDKRFGLALHSAMALW